MLMGFANDSTYNKARFSTNFLSIIQPETKVKGTIIVIIQSTYH
jgi:hypothetical protein